MLRLARPTVTAISVVAAATLALAAGALPAGAATKPPVSIPGKVTNEGVTKVRGGAVTIKAENFYFEKTFVKSTPGTVQVTVKNTGTAPHTFTIDGQDIDEQLAPGASKTVTVDVTAGAPVVFYCRFHQGSGMQGAFFTKKGTAVASTGASSSNGSSGY